MSTLNLRKSAGLVLIDIYFEKSSFSNGTIDEVL